MADEWKEQYDYYFNKVNNANVESAKKQMEFQERMSSTAHQREVKDLIAAGLNPVLSANNGASSPMGAYANVDSSPISAKFARQNLNKELENARLITAMQNDNAMAIAMRQIGAQLELGKYTTDENNKTSRFNSIISEYGVGAALAYGLAEDMYNGIDPSGSLNEKVSNYLGNSSFVNNLIDGINNSAKTSQETQNRTDNLISKINEALSGYDPNYKNKTKDNKLSKKPPQYSAQFKNDYAKKVWNSLKKSLSNYYNPNKKKYFTK